MNTAQKGTLLLRFSSGRPRFSKLDKGLTIETQTSHGMADDALGVTKKLIPKDYFKKWDKTVSYLRTEFYRLTSSWDDSGYRLCTVDAFWKFQRIWMEHSQVLEDFKEDFLSRYPEIREAQRTRLNGNFDESEFPPLETVRERFRYETDCAELPRKGTIAQFYSEEQEREIIEKVEQRMAQSHHENYERILKALKHLADTTASADRTKNCKSSTLENVKELVEVIPAINFAGDPALDQLASEVSMAFKHLEMSTIKDDQGIREKVSAAARQMAQQLEGNRNHNQTPPTGDPLQPKSQAVRQVAEEHGIEVVELRMVDSDDDGLDFLNA